MIGRAIGVSAVPGPPRSWEHSYDHIRPQDTFVVIGESWAAFAAAAKESNSARVLTKVN